MQCRFWQRCWPFSPVPPFAHVHLTWCRGKHGALREKTPKSWPRKWQSCYPQMHTLYLAYAHTADHLYLCWLSPWLELSDWDEKRSVPDCMPTRLHICSRVLASPWLAGCRLHYQHEHAWKPCVDRLLAVPYKLNHMPTYIHTYAVNIRTRLK